MSKKVGIIGAGVVGTAIGVVLHDKGYEITGVHDKKSESTKTLVDRIECATYASPQEVSRSTDILFITTTDSAIQSVVDELANSRAFTDGQVVIHMSGAQSSEILNKARHFGARILSLHPLQSFANLEMAINNIPGSIFSIEGDKDTYAVGIDMVEKLEGEYFFIDPAAKPLYHAGACVVSNYLVTVINLGIKLMEITGVPREMTVKALLPLIKGTIRNIETVGIPDALTGPISRGDISTILNHLACMEETGAELIDLYSCLGYYTSQVALEKGTIDMEQMTQFQQTFARMRAKVDLGS
ncbi:hypothetical protein ASZ90_017606 [hydrocarbon metagenome]|uniref:2-dehydropantoate 2-reductase n=1 Tax=hydrocarbon metagenome TaxID=938273 RepID=A0A0W8E8N6_9ZZZZ